jgi:hypothetical protein
MKLYNFARLIQRYSCDFDFLPAASGTYDAGKWVPGEAPASPKHGAIVPMSKQKLYQPGGTYTTQDRQLFMTSPLPDALEGAHVQSKGNIYTIEQDTDWSDYADVYAYVLRRVSQFDRPASS